MTPFTIKNNLARNVCEAAKQLDVIKPGWAQALSEYDLNLSDGIVRTVFRKETAGIEPGSGAWHVGMRLWYSDYDKDTWPAWCGSYPHCIWNYSTDDLVAKWKAEILARRDNPQAYHEHLDAHSTIKLEKTIKFILTIRDIVVELDQKEYIKLKELISKQGIL